MVLSSTFINPLANNNVTSYSNTNNNSINNENNNKSNNKSIYQSNSNINVSKFLLNFKGLNQRNLMFKVE